MKRKFISIFIALVLALSLCLVTAVPVAAVEVEGVELQTVGTATADWSTEQKHSGSWSAKLYVADGVADWAEVSIPVDIAIEDIYELSFWERVELFSAGTGYDVNIILGVDCDGDGDFEADLPAWHQGTTMHTLAVLNGDSFVEMDGMYGTANYPWTGPDTLDWTEVDAYNCPGMGWGWWTPKNNGVGSATFGWTVVTLGDFQAELDGSNDDGLIDKGDRVKCVKLQIGGSGNWMDVIAHVDDLTINGITYDLEPSSTVGLTAELEEITAISVTPTSIDFGTLSAGVTSSVETINVENIGSVSADIETNVALAGTVFDHLTVDGLDLPTIGLINDLGIGANVDVDAVLLVPVWYSAKGIETNQLVFVASSSP